MELSLPYRIALLAVAAVGVLWFVALRPGGTADSVRPAANAPGVAGLARATQAAKGAVAKSDASAAANEAAADAVGGSAPSTAASQSAKAAKTPAAASAASQHKTRTAPRDRAGAILADLRHGKVAVVAFAGNKAADDVAVRDALKGVGRRGGKVVVRAVPIGSVASYGSITRGVQVQQSPTVVVIGSDRKARTIVGLTDAGEINQLVADVARK